MGVECFQGCIPNSVDMKLTIIMHMHTGENEELTSSITVYQILFSWPFFPSFNTQTSLLKGIICVWVNQHEIWVNQSNIISNTA